MAHTIRRSTRIAYDGQTIQPDERDERFIAEMSGSRSLVSVELEGSWAAMTFHGANGHTDAVPLDDLSAAIHDLRLLRDHGELEDGVERMREEAARAVEHACALLDDRHPTVAAELRGAMLALIEAATRREAVVGSAR